PKGTDEALTWLKAVEPLASDISMAKYLISHIAENQINNHTDNNDKKLILMGALAITHPDYSKLILLTNLISQLTNAKVGILSEGANAAGAWLAGCVPHRLAGGEKIKSGIGLNVDQMWHKKLKAYLLLNMEPELDCV